MRAALAEGDMAELAHLLDREWQLRRGLAEGSTPKIEEISRGGRGGVGQQDLRRGRRRLPATIAEPDALPAVREAPPGRRPVMLCASGYRSTG